MTEMDVKTAMLQIKTSTTPISKIAKKLIELPDFSMYSGKGGAKESPQAKFLQG